MARIFAKALNCPEIKEGNPCGNCNICVSTADGSLVDVIEIDAASNRGIDEIRDLREKVLFSPNITQRKVYIIDEVHMLTKEAFNALLKTLEEPPEHAFFLLATTEIHKIPETIISRCQTFIFQRFIIEQLVERLQYISEEEKFKVEPAALDLIAHKAEGGLRDAISLLEQIAAETDHDITETAVRKSLGISDTETLKQFHEALLQKDATSGLEILKTIVRNGGDFRTFGHDFLNFCRKKLHESLGNPKKVTELLTLIGEIEKAIGRLKTSPIIELPFEIAVITLCQGASVTSNSTASEAPVPSPTIPPVVEKPPAKMPKADPVTPKPQSIPTPKPDPAEDNGFVFNSEEKKETKAKNPVAEPVVPAFEGSLSVEVIQSKMASIAEIAGIPSFAKKSFLTCIPQLTGNKIVFTTQSNFHLEKLQPETIRVPLQDALTKLFNEKLSIDFQANKNQAVTPKPSGKATVDDFLNF
jgi:DNA polymerase III subunit gamma/tau